MDIKGLVILAVLGAGMSTWGGDIGQADEPDSRTRTFVYPKRIVWQSTAVKRDDGWAARCDAVKMEKLLEHKRGQVCEGYFGSSLGCELVNRGEPAGVILDFGRELHGGVQLGMSPSTSPYTRLRLRFGESVAETMSSVGDGKHATNNHAMRDFDIEVPVFGAIEVGNTGFRFLRIDLVTGGKAGFEFVRAVSLMRPMKEIGGFRSSDDRLNRVYDTAVRTVHLCCQEHLWDGIKRDRLVWMGDAYPETRTILAVYGAADILPETLDFAAATTPPDKWMQTMAPYTLWWIRNYAAWYRYTGDLAWLRKHEAYLRATLKHVSTAISPKNTWSAGCFLDWPTKHNPKAVEAGMQGLAATTFDDVAFVFAELGDAAEAETWAKRAKAFRAVKRDPNGAKSAAAILALAGVREPGEMYEKVLGQNGMRDVSTFYGYFMLEAMSLAGHDQRALDTVRDYWGGMIDVGATSFWENFDLSWTNNCYRIDELPVVGRKDVHGDYGEFCYPGFRHSLCHGWAGGPAAWCINHVLGIRPLDVGCRTVEVKPFLGDLAWAEGAMALPNGEAVKVRVEATGGAPKVDVQAPGWVKVVR